MERFQRQIILPGIGTSGQQKLKSSSVLVVGAGGLGCAVLPYLVAAGVGRIGLVDGDRVEESNLHRQVLYNENSIGSLKVDSAQQVLQRMNSTTQLEIVPEYLSAENVDNLIEHYDLIIDATDNLEVRYTLDEACCSWKKPMIYGSIFRFQGQVSVFNYKGGPSYSSLFPKEDKAVLNCEEAGVLGTTVGITGMLQANEALKIILGIGEVLSGKILIYNMLKNDQQIFELAIQEEQTSKKATSPTIDLISPEVAFEAGGLLLDVRELGEKPVIAWENSIQIPLSVLEHRLDELSKKVKIYVFCQAGTRAMSAAKILKEADFLQVKAVRGGASDILKLIQIEVNSIEKQD
ncbi:HesA/MoeB/ThiF family protein [Algoriphagus antarcticus]|uniref:Molybdopterin-synthase adenylyltransferase n=1 Tax=Algoriphagus antarcticus TaxID=238540 RepID=A0A3E0DS27_9BACT|nr:HesA/MoeB/ThiF family protein [Algoriphagus antarcticus]REG86322.1 adenylyltransferase/sulfurtransferase [Algoriphagus antarcticus]